MSSITLEQVAHLAEQLSPAERVLLIQRLQATTPISGSQPTTREAILAEHKRRLASEAFAHAQSLANRYATPDFDLSEQELQAGIREFSGEWEQELYESSEQN